MTSPRDASRTGTNRIPPATPTPSKVLIVFGTRPEAVKLCPLISAIRKSFSDALNVTVCVTAQHRGMLDQVLGAFGVRPDYDLDVMQPGQSLSDLTSRLLTAIDPVLAQEEPAIVVVQGDTTSAFCAALASFYRRIPIAHVEAGLRTFDILSPFPEEMNRTFVGRLAAIHFAPTERAAENLKREGVPSSAIRVTGNTGIDAVMSVRDALVGDGVAGVPFEVPRDKKLIVITAHRRESFGPGLDSICDAVSELARREDAFIVWPIHPNPKIRSVVERRLPAHANVLLTDPLDYVPFVALLNRAYLVVTDSGGIQEEAPSLGKPVLVLRDKTERPEAVEAGTARLVGTDRSRIVSEVTRLLDDAAAYDEMARRHNPYGDGRASERIAHEISQFLRE